ncbi:MAG TPA: ABC transporter substrate-binding protein [Xanthobacteraceae bacterium]|jgi:4,5-dihydroxyphthalate decarboxylase|nr:ABC transporter substrate-binding protein [Xanthobacteraceae bacterium]
MAGPKYKTVTRTQGNNQALKDGTVKPKNFEFDFEEVDPLIAAFRRMVRGNEYDICEMAITTYICAKAHGKKMTAIPVFLIRAFHHGAILINTKAGIKTPKDLEGKRVGVNRGYTVTTGVWARAVLQEEYGVDLSKITWVLSGDEHVAEYQPPSNVVPIEKGKDMKEMLISGELAAAIGVEVEHPDIKPLIPNALEEGLKALRERGHYPINHTVVIKDELLEKNPQLAVDVFNAFAESKRVYLDRLKSGKIEKPTGVDKVHQKVMDIAGDPLPYGIEPNRKVLESLVQHALTQGIITRPVKVEDLFAPATRDMTA